MSSSLDIIHDEKMPASFQMQKDSDLIDNLAHLKKPLVRFYEWASPAITYGYFIRPEEYFIEGFSGFDLARRPTGGGILFHTADFAFTVALPKAHPKFSNNVLDNYCLMNEAVLDAVCKMNEKIELQREESGQSIPHFCMASATKYDLLLDGLKVGGSAQRKTQFGFVHQASVFLLPPAWDSFEAILRNGQEVVRAMKATSSSLYQKTGSIDEVRKLKEGLTKALIQSLETTLK